MKKFILTIFSLSLLPLITEACSYQVVIHRFSNDPWYYWKIYLAIVILATLIFILRKNKVLLVILSLILITIVSFFFYQYPAKTDEIICATENGAY